MGKNVSDILVSYVNLGTHFDKDENNLVPNLPKNDSLLSVVNLKDVWMSQKTMNPNDAKGVNGMIFPFSFNTLYSIEKIKTDNLCNNGVVFVDIDCGEEYVQEIFDNIDECNQMMNGPIICGATTKHGLHLLFKSDPMTANEYSIKSCGYLTAFAWVLKKITGIDLRELPKALDSCTFSMKQRLFLRYSKNIYWNDYAVNVVLDKKTKSNLMEEYEDLWRKVNAPMETNKHLKRFCSGKIDEVVDVCKHEYIDHHVRWSLFDSLCCCFESEDSVMNAWYRCCNLIEPLSHSVDFFMNEPKKNKWYQKWIESNNHWCNKELLESFGYHLKDMDISWKHIVMPNKFEDLLKF